MNMLEAMKKIKAKGIPISLCTAKGLFAVRKIIEDVELDNCHIRDGGALLIDPIDNKILEAHEIEPNLSNLFRKKIRKKLRLRKLKS